MKLTEIQSKVMKWFYDNKNHSPYIHKHRKSRAWFQTNCRDWHPVSDSTIKALVSKGLIIKTSNNHWHLSPEHPI